MSDDTQPYTYEKLKSQLAEQDSREKVKQRLEEYRLNDRKTSKPYNASDTRFAYFACVQAGTENR